MPPPLARIIQQLKREPSRTGSIVITVFGDAIVPRGGSVWLGTLLEFFEQLDIDASVVRTAMSRLTADGWFERNRIGRNSFYRLVQSGRQTFDIATKHIYGPPASDWTGRFELLLIGNGGDRDAAREALRRSVNMLQNYIAYRYLCYILAPNNFREVRHVYAGAQFVRGRRPQH